MSKEYGLLNFDEFLLERIGFNKFIADIITYPPLLLPVFDV